MGAMLPYIEIDSILCPMANHGLRISFKSIKIASSAFITLPTMWSVVAVAPLQPTPHTPFLMESSERSTVNGPFHSDYVCGDLRLLFVIVSDDG